MKKINPYRSITSLLCILLGLGMTNTIMAQQDSVPGVPVVKLHYFNNNNTVQYLILECMLKKKKVLTPQKNKAYEIYLDSSISEKLIAKVQTDESGKAKAFIPPSLKTAWDATPQHKFTVKADGEEVISDYSITKAKIQLDTANTDGAKSITASVMKMDKNLWIPAKGVEMKVGIARLGGILSAGDAQTYTTDSSGKVTVDFKKDSLPGDKNGIFTIVARADDNEQFGNLLAEKSTSWGVPLNSNTDFFNKRALWSTRTRTPVWLLFMAYSIVIAVWGTLIYLIMQVIKLKKLGTKPVG